MYKCFLLYNCIRRQLILRGREREHTWKKGLYSICGENTVPGLWRVTFTPSATLGKSLIISILSSVYSVFSHVQCAMLSRKTRRSA